MDVSNAIAPSVSAAVNSPQQPAPKNDKQPEKQEEEKQQDFTVVKLSEKAQQMNRAENRNTERAETRPQEAAEPPGIQLIEGEKKGGRVNTLA